jgi:hypothetical protein
MGAPLFAFFAKGGTRCFLIAHVGNAMLLGRVRPFIRAFQPATQASPGPVFQRNCLLTKIIAAVHPRSYIVAVKLFGVLLLVAGSLCSQTDGASLDEGFDKPVKKTVVDFGPSPYYLPRQHVRKTLTCYYYSTFTVKEYDEGQKGAEWLSIVPLADAGCSQTHSEGENVLTWREWSGYFWGAKDRYAVFTSPHGGDGGVPFAVFDVTGRKLFEDASLLDYYQKKLQIKNAFRISGGPGQNIRLTYLRVVRAGCNLKTGQAECWNKARAAFGITQTDIPVCSRYEPEADWESAIVYPVSVLLTDSPQIKGVDGPVFCWPTD